MITIRDGDLDDPRVAALLAAHLQAAHGDTPPQHSHALGLDGLRSPDITLWTAWADDALAGVGALKALSADHGEVKSMRTHPGHLRRGVAAAILTRIVTEARARGYASVSLETGTVPSYAPATAL